MGSASQSQQQTYWGSSDGVAYIHTTPLLQGKPISEPRMSATQPRSPFEAVAVQSQSPQAQPHDQHRHACHQNHNQLPVIAELSSNHSISPSDTAQYSGGSPTTSSYSSPSASTAANTSSTDLRLFPDGSVEGPLHLQPITPHHPMHGNAAFHDSQDASSSQQEAGTDFKLGTGGLNKSRYRGVSYDKKKRKWRVQIKVSIPWQ